MPLSLIIFSSSRFRQLLPNKSRCFVAIGQIHEVRTSRNKVVRTFFTKKTEGSQSHVWNVVTKTNDLNTASRVWSCCVCMPHCTHFPLSITDISAFASEIRQKTQRCRKNAYGGLENAYYLVNRNVTEMYANCGSRNARCSVSKVEIISSAFKWLIVLRSAIKTRDQTDRVLKNASQRAQADRYCLHSLCEPRIDTCCSVLLGPLEEPK